MTRTTRLPALVVAAAGASRITIRGAKLVPDVYKLTGTAKNGTGTSIKRKARLVVLR